MECNSVKNTPFLPLPDHSFLEGVGGGKVRKLITHEASFLKF